jgi:hypothetical protein
MASLNPPEEPAWPAGLAFVTAFSIIDISMPLKVVHDIVRNSAQESLSPPHSAQIATRDDASKTGVSTQG